MDYTQTIDVAAGIIWRGGHFLAAQRPTNKAMEGYWEFPGGKLEGNESPEEALKRELAEELGIGVREVSYWQCVEHRYADRNLNVRLYFFHVTDFVGEPCAVEGQNLRWISPDEALNLGFLPADAGVLEQILALNSFR
ncbi:MAG: (deoxy)nucleoside triphosphate pyrophosphohydrolase [Desulfovibrio sp.]|nr:(deoxy)nucleoside triphosphate pyrophosphohydrolase [Desulfovibrio sp.]